MNLFSQLVTVTGAFLAFVLVLVVFVIGPIFSILAINTLFGTDIKYTFGTWCASFWLTALLAGSTVK